MSSTRSALLYEQYNKAHPEPDESRPHTLFHFDIILPYNVRESTLTTVLQRIQFWSVMRDTYKQGEL